MIHRPLFVVFVSVLILLMGSCSGQTEMTEEIEEKEIIDDGKYCANIEYYNKQTGRNSNYSLFVEVEDNHLVKIYWPNGGWLDESHFEPTEIEENTTHFVNDKGYEYDVTINSSSESCELSLLEEQENRYHDSVMRQIEIQKQDLELAELEAEIRIANMGHQVIYTGCKDLFFFKYNNQFVLAQKVGYSLTINAGDRLDCEIETTGITSVGNLTAHNAGNIKVLSMSNTQAKCKDKFDSFCDQNMKTWEFK